MPTFAPATRIRGRLNAYSCGTIDDIDAHLTRLIARWTELLTAAEPTAKMREDYTHDVDLLLERRTRLKVQEA